MKVICKCAHEFQDKEHGKQVRVATPGQKHADGTQSVKCTVCSASHRVKAS